MNATKKNDRPSRLLPAGALALACFGGAAFLLIVQGCDRPAENDMAATETVSAPAAEESVAGDPHAGVGFVGSKACTECHGDEHAEWMGSHHQLAMQPATEETVLGDFEDASFTHYGDTTKFFRRDGKFMVNATGPDGTKQDYPVKYAFGVYPLQQYLIPFPGGRYQTLQVCWDSRPADEGGQRWYHLYPDEPIPHNDVLHWTGPNFNWAYMCADCHSTNLDRNYDVTTDSYDTTFSEINVSCEACHGAGERHVAWANETDEAAKGEYGDHYGLTIRLKEPQEAQWLIDPETQEPKRSVPLESTVQVETCAPCHSHRRLVDEHPGHGKDFFDTHLPSVLRDVLYHPDGQINEEVYVYGSFVQSKMFHSDVRCTDCHNPHTLKLKAPGNALCVQCHLATKYDNPSHHFHQIGSTGAACVDCHMPIKHYMVVDPRRDHSIRIPRPDLSVKLGTPNACTNCHEDKDDQWAADAFHQWWGDGEREPHYGEIIAAARRREAGSEGPLISLAREAEKPAIVRATAVAQLGQHPTQASIQAVVAALDDPDPVVRQTALGGISVIDPAQRLSLAGKLLDDPVLAVRAEAARVLATVPREAMSDEQQASFDSAAADFIAAEEAIADRGGAHISLGTFYGDLGDNARAEEAYRTAIRVEPRNVHARINLAEFLYRNERVAEGEPFLREAVELEPNAGITHEALGRYFVRQKRYQEGTEAIGRAAALLPGESRIQRFYAVALNDTGRYAEALPFMDKAIALEPGNPQFLLEAVAMCRDQADWPKAVAYAEELVRRHPGVPGFVQLLDSIRGQAGGSPQ